MTTPTSALVEEATVADGMSARIRDLVCIVENYDPDSEDEDRDDRCPECKTPLGAPEEPGMEPTPFCNCCAHAVVEELAEAVQGLRQVIRQAETARDAALQQSAAWEIQAQDMRDRLVKAEAERDAQREQVLRLTGELEALATKTGDVEWREDAAVEVVKMRGRQISELTATRDLLLTENARLQQQLSRPDPVVHETPVDGVVPCCGQKLHDLKDGARVNEGPLVNCDRMRLLSRVGEVSSANLLLTAENARLQKEHNAYVQRLSADALQVASKYQRERDEARAQIATLELLQRGGK